MPPEHHESTTPISGAGDTPAWLFRERRAFLAFLERRVGDRDLAEDILQDSLAKALEHAASIREEEATQAWFYRVLRNAIIDHSRRAAAADRRLHEFAQRLERSPEPDPSQTEELCQCVRALVDSLRPDYASAIREVDIAGKSLADYARGAGITANNAGVRIHRARKALRKEVLGFCRLCAEHGCLDCSCRSPRSSQPDST